MNYATQQNPHKLKLFFVHIPKNMGNFIYKNYPVLEQPSLDASLPTVVDVSSSLVRERTRFYGLYDSIYEYYDTYGMNYNRAVDTEPYLSVSVDHLTLFELVKLRIINYHNVPKYFFFAIMREPVDRFVSLCNYWDVSPDQLIYNIQRIDKLRESKYNLFQHLRCQSDYIYAIQRFTKNYRIFRMDKRDEIRGFMKIYYPESEVNFEGKIYPSREKYTKSSLLPRNILFIQKYYKSDFELYRSLK